jgi:uncharacterized protein (DUF2147 family)
MIRKLIAAGALVAAMTAPTLADPIVGNWKTKSGETAAISACGGAFCVKLKTGKYAGKQIGKMKARRRQILGHHHRSGQGQDLFRLRHDLRQRR